jgi:hypothetical protein
VNIPLNLLSMTEEDLYLELASAITGGNVAPADRDQAERIGHAHFQNALPEIRRLVCGSSVTASLLKKDDDSFLVASAVAELIAAHFAAPAATATVAVLAARMGLRRLCPMPAP